MTHDLVQSDIELATRLRDEHRPDEEIIRALVRRGVEPGQAAHLVEDLHSGKKLTVQASLPPELTLAHRSRSRSAGRGHEQRSHKRSPESASRREPPAQPAAPARKKPAVIWLVAAAVVGLILVGIVALFLRRQAESNSQPQPAPKAAPAKAGRTVRKAMARVPATAQTGALAPLALELRPDGLHLGASHLTPGNLLTAVASSLGAATRTNQVGQTDTVIYTYDHLGLLIYSQKAGATNSIILDCEASGGIHGTTSPFTGTVMVGGQMIQADTDPQTLTAIEELGLKHPGSHSGIWGGPYHNLELVFAYLKSPRHLSLSEIDLK